jgi:hypothetical protein
MQSHAALLALLREGTHELYQLGVRLGTTEAIPPVLERTTIIDAGPLRFGVEDRVLADHDLDLSEVGIVGPPIFGRDAGPTVHIFG